MASNINPSNINGSYPIAGQDNDSQGFRDNFTNIRTNLNYAKNEITDLQQKVVLKAALSGGTLDNDMGGSTLHNVVLRNARQAVRPVSVDDTALVQIDTGGSADGSSGGHSVVQIDNNSKAAYAIEFLEWPSDDSFTAIRVEIFAAHDSTPNLIVTLPAEVTIGTEFIDGLVGDTLTLPMGTTALPKVYWFEFSSTDGGETVTIRDLTRISVESVAHATTSDTVTTAAQPAITSVGTLTSLTMLDQGAANVPATILGKAKFAEQADTALDAVTATTALKLTSGTPTAIGVSGDTAGMVKVDTTSIYVCTANYDGLTAIWKKVDLTSI